jgi:hypothetical protein
MKELGARRRHAAAMVLAVMLGMGPTVGDIGSCGQQADALDARTFFIIKAGIDCKRCGECGLSGRPCDRACNQAPETAFPPGCQPFVHDGEVCLHALIHASCDDYASYVSDAAPTAPSECQFCPAR